MIRLIDYISLTQSDIEDQVNAPKNRRNSINMILAHEALSILISRMPVELEFDKIDIIFCTGEGELDQTYKFYQALTQQKIARPIYFQNSLHNSTLGCVSLKFKNISSGTTISSGDLSIENAIEVTLASPSRKPTIILGIDVYPEDLFSLKSSFYGENVRLASGVNAALFLPQTHTLYSNSTGMIISDVKYIKSHLPDFVFKDYFASNSLSILMEAYTSGEHQIPRASGKTSIFTIEV